MSKILTAKEFLQSIRDECLVDFMRASDRQKVEDKLKEFAKLHVKAALEAAFKSVGHCSVGNHKNSILNAYPLEKIK